LGVFISAGSAIRELWKQLRRLLLDRTGAGKEFSGSGRQRWILKKGPTSQREMGAEPLGAREKNDGKSSTQ